MGKPVIREFYRDESYKTLGEQYNNLGNIAQGSSGIWPGQEGIGWNGKNDRAFKAFASIEDGVAAQAFLLERYVNRNGDRTFYDIVSRYAPASDNNNVGRYVGHVTERVNAIAKSLGYTGPALTNRSDLQQAFADKTSGDLILAATIKAMNEVEVGEASNRLASPGTVLQAVQTKYRKTYGSYAGYSRAIGQDPGFRAPSKKRKGVAETDGDHTPDDTDFDAIGKEMMEGFVKLLCDFFKALFGGLGSTQENTTPVVSDLDITKLIPKDLLDKLTASGTDIRTQETQIANFDLDYNGHINAKDVTLIREQLKTSNVSIPADANDAQVLTLYANQLLQQKTIAQR